MNYNPSQDQSATPPIIDDQGQPATSVTADASAPTQPAVKAFNCFMDQTVWVDWRIEMRNGKPTKIPYNPNTGKKAEADDPSTWGTFDQAVEGQKHIVNGSGGGLGIELGDLGDGYALGGIDLDTCRSEDGRFEPWATEVIKQFGSYTEISPSGTGAKVIFKCRVQDFPKIREAMGGAQWGKMFKRKSGSDHPPAIELYIGHRFFAVTFQHLPETPDVIQIVDAETVLWVLQKAGPGFVKNAGALAGNRPSNASGHNLNAAAQAGLHNDNSRSAVAQRLAYKLHREGKNYDEYCEAVRTDSVTSSWYTEKGIRNNNRELRRAWEKAEKNTTLVEDDDRPPAFSDEALALQFTTLHGDEARYVAKWGGWLFWNDSRWQVDETMQVFDQARAVCRSASAKITDPKLGRLAANVASAKTVAAVASLARADRRHAATVDQWDAGVMLLNTPGGIVDLRTGVLMSSDRKHYMTKTTAVAPGGDCPLWQKFLDEITAGDVALQEFLQRISGYALTGSIVEHALFFLYGTGGNGKGVFLNTVSEILGDYAAVAPMETFIASRHEQHPTDLASLRGARLVTAQETEKGRRWAESKIKTLTGGDPISARFMRQDFFTFKPQFKLLIAGNHKPGLRGVDEAIRRRMNLVPFTVKITNPDPYLRDKLDKERPGILKWAVDGCLAWQRIGLAPPPAVRDATDQYLADEDTLAQWIDECCDCGKLYTESSARLFESWRVWAERTGEYAGIQRQFTQALKERGFTAYQEPGTKRAMFRGIGLRVTAPGGDKPDTGGGTLAAVAKRPVSSITEGQATLYEILHRGEARRG